MATNFTPGPWIACKTKFQGRTIGFHITDGKNGSLIPIAEAGEGIARATTCERLDANAELIAQAPTLRADLNEAQLQLVILLDYLDKFRADRCRCENNGDLCEFCSMLYDAKLATKGMEL